MADLIIMPKLGFDMAEGTLIRWVKAEGEPIVKGDLIAEIETDKATVEIESAFDGVVKKHLVDVDAIVPVNNAIAVIGGADEEIDYQELNVGSAPDSETKTKEIVGDESVIVEIAPDDDFVIENRKYPAGVKISPLARNIARARGIDVLLITGTGPKGRIIKKDIENFNTSSHDQSPEKNLVAPPIYSQPLTEAPQDKVIKISRLRQTIGKRMVQSKMEHPSFYVTNTIDAAPLIELRKSMNEFLTTTGEKISVNDFIVKATSLALRKFPNLNAALKGKEITQFGHINIGIAVSVENGLLTIVIPDTDQKQLRQISSEVKEKAIRVRSGKVSPDDISGSTFSISNLGMFDVRNFVAIINPPEAAILAIGSAYQTPVVKEGKVVPGWEMQMTISVDHRISDGAEAAQFLQTLAKYLENPIGLML
jgi:pyruvate dehydrogenase E2 component (dihydrolipoamide acetyltransferase)